MHSFAIFDMDGTIIDSMPAWKNMWSEYLRSQGVDPPVNVKDCIINKTLSETSHYFVNNYGLNKTGEEVMREFHDLMVEKYYQGFPPKEGVVEYLGELHDHGVKTCVVTATAEKLACACLQKNGLWDLFDFVISCENIGKSKAHPDAYNSACTRFKSKPCDTIVFEDAPYAAKTAKVAGYYTIGIFDEYYAAYSDEMKSLCDDFINGFDTATGKFW